MWRTLLSWDKPRSGKSSPGPSRRRSSTAVRGSSLYLNRHAAQGVGRDNRRFIVALDFDEFLLFAVRLLEENEETARWLRETYGYVLVSGYQGVNHDQHRLLALLTVEHGNLFAVGDPLQNPFSWRGSDIRYLLEFQRDCTEAQVLALEQNYRGAQVILALANTLSAALH